jgi:TPR repeat protein
MRMLGVLYYNGLSVPQNRAKGLEWYRKAAAAGSKTAQEELGQLGATQ